MTSLKRAIVLFPKFENVQLIEQIRSLFDPLANTIRPHITLVFPFESRISSAQLQTHICQALQGIKPFPVLLRDVTDSEAEYLFLNIKKGNDQLIELHDRLYSGILSPFYHFENTFVPHLTLGRIQNRAGLLTAFETARKLTAEFQTIIEEVAVYQLGHKNSTEFMVKF